MGGVMQESNFRAIPVRDVRIVSCPQEGMASLALAARFHQYLLELGGVGADRAGTRGKLGFQFDARSDQSLQQARSIPHHTI